MRSQTVRSRQIITSKIPSFRVCGFLVALCALFSGPGATDLVLAADINIGTGSRAGVYFRVGRAICKLVEGAEGPSCEAPSTAGSVFNLNSVRTGQLQFAVAQSDMQYYAVNGEPPFAETGADKSLRALFSVHSEPFTLVVRRDANIKSFDDLAGRRVNIGNPGSGQRATMEIVMQAKGWTEDDFALADELPASQQSLALCHDKVQAMIYTVGHPNDSVAQAVRLCDAALADVKGAYIDGLIEKKPFYARSLIPAGQYREDAPAVATFGVKATVVTSSDVDADTVYTVVKALFENLDKFRAMHPAFSTLEPTSMIKDGLSAPLHEGAQRYYLEQGWLQ